MHYITVKGILSSNNNLNIYRGCTHGCIYCDSRSTCYQIDHEFNDVAIKENAIELLEIALRRKNKKVIVSTGSMSDPYVTIEAEVGMTRRMLEVINKYQHGVAILTKSTLILNDFDLLKAIKKHSKVIISTTLTTLDDNLCQIIEPNVAKTSERVAMLKRFSEQGFITGVWLSPILPYINDTEENILGLLEKCLEIKVKYIMCFGIGVTLREGDREFFYHALDKHFPGLKEKYIKMYGSSYMINSPNHQSLYKKVIDFCKKHQILYDIDEIFKYIKTYEKTNYQLSLFE